MDKDVANKWCNFCEEFDQVKQLKFKRNVGLDSTPTKLVVFADSSQEAYGIVIYAIQGNNSNFLFSKVKVTPIIKRTLPSLELLAIYLGFKCLGTILNDKNFNLPVTEIQFVTDSQVALTWLLTGKAVKKNVFVNNRLKDILVMSDEFKSKNIQFSYHYVPSEYNVADMLTRSCKIQNFVSRFDLWINGPKWMLEPPEFWPKGYLGCVPSKYTFDSVNLVCSTAINEKAETGCVVDIDRYSSYSKLLQVTSKIFVAINKFKGIECNDPKLLAFQYLIKCI